MPVSPQHLGFPSSSPSLSLSTLCFHHVRLCYLCDFVQSITCASAVAYLCRERACSARSSLACSPRQGTVKRAFLASQAHNKNSVIQSFVCRLSTRPLPLYQRIPTQQQPTSFVSFKPRSRSPPFFQPHTAAHSSWLCLSARSLGPFTRIHVSLCPSTRLVPLVVPGSSLTPRSFVLSCSPFLRDQVCWKVLKAYSFQLPPS